MLPFYFRSLSCPQDRKVTSVDLLQVKMKVTVDEAGFLGAGVVIGNGGLCGFYKCPVAAGKCFIMSQCQVVDAM